MNLLQARVGVSEGSAKAGRKSPLIPGVSEGSAKAGRTIILFGKIHQEGYRNVYGIILDPDFRGFAGLGPSNVFPFSGS